jgi:hypothetical protein
MLRLSAHWIKVGTLAIYVSLLFPICLLASTDTAKEDSAIEAAAEVSSSCGGLLQGPGAEQYPIELLDQSDNTWMYSTDCCCPGGWVGILMSPNAISPLGCPNGISGYKIVSTEIELPIYGLPGATRKIRLSVAPHFDENRSTVFPSLPAGQQVYRDPYDDQAQPFNTAVSLLDKNRNRRYFSLVRTKVTGITSGPGGGDVEYEYEFLMLIRSRPTLDYHEIDATGEPNPEPNPVTPGFPISNPRDLLQVDWATSFVKVVEISLPLKANSTERYRVNVLLVNRLDEP